MNLPHTYTTKNETRCCAIPNVREWENREILFKNKPFIRLYTRSFFYIPINMTSVMRRLQETAEQAKATMPAEDVMILSHDISPWKAEQLLAVTKHVNGADNVALTGTFLTRVFDEPYQNAGKWADILLDYVKDQGKKLKGIYMFYTTCPKCAKHYGHNYTIGMAKV